MISGFNTDVKHREVVFHVQTEDKGEDAAWVESLIYVGGRILARKRVTYKDLLQSDGKKAAIAKLMDRQHRLMIAQIRKGRFDPDVFDEAADGAPGPAPDPPTGEPVPEPRSLPPGELADALSEPDSGVAVAPEELQEPMTPSLPGKSPSLDQVIFEYLSSAAAEESLVLLMDESPALESGLTSTLDLRTSASRSGRPIQGANISVRMISTTTQPVILTQGSTDTDGCVQLRVTVPEVTPRTAALIITATSDIGSAEIKHLL